MDVVSINNVYASGGSRLIAWFIDRLIIGAVLSVITFKFFGWEWHSVWHPNEWLSYKFNFGLFSKGFLYFVLHTVYFTAMEASKFQGTIGKIVMGLKVLDKNNQRLDVPKALLRNLSKIISGIILGIGYLMIIFDDKKQGLHDKIADTFVVRT